MNILAPIISMLFSTPPQKLYIENPTQKPEDKHMWKNKPLNPLNSSIQQIGLWNSDLDCKPTNHKHDVRKLTL